jgi:uncharacterized protein YndB with AHSA1/START domain
MYSTSIEIPATPSKVFAVLTDVSLLKQWTPEIVEVRPPEGGLRVGAISSALVEEFGRRFSAELVVAALEPDVKLAYDMTTPMWSGHVEYLLTHCPKGTNLSLFLVPKPPKGIPYFLVRSMAVLTRPLVQWKLRSRLTALRKVVEAN